MVVTVDGQLFYSCSRRCRTSSTTRTSAPSRRSTASSRPASLSSLRLPLRVHRADAQPLPLDRHDRQPVRAPAGARRARAKARRKRETPLERLDAADPNRKMALEETPWLRESRGGDKAGNEFLQACSTRRSPARSATTRSPSSRKAQLPSAASPGSPAGPPSPYMTLYIMCGLAQGRGVRRARCRATWCSAAGATSPATTARSAAASAEGGLLLGVPDLPQLRRIVLSRSVLDGAMFLSADERREILDFSFKHWSEHSPLLKLQLALTLERAGPAQGRRAGAGERHGLGEDDARRGDLLAARGPLLALVQRHIETHAWALRTLMEIAPERPAPRRPGAVALPQQEAQPLEVDAGDGRGALLARRTTSRRRARWRARRGDGRRSAASTTTLRLRAGPIHRARRTRS